MKGRIHGKGVIHQVAICQGCDWQNGDYLTALRTAHEHAVETGHDVRVDTGSVMTIRGKKTEGIDELLKLTGKQISEKYRIMRPIADAMKGTWITTRTYLHVGHSHKSGKLRFVVSTGKRWGMRAIVPLYQIFGNAGNNPVKMEDVMRAAMRVIEWIEKQEHLGEE